MFLVVRLSNVFSMNDILFDILEKKSLDITYCISKMKSTCAIISHKHIYIGGFNPPLAAPDLRGTHDTSLGTLPLLYNVESAHL